jgi:hypothetical protein
MTFGPFLPDHALQGHAPGSSKEARATNHTLSSCRAANCNVRKLTSKHMIRINSTLLRGTVEIPHSKQPNEHHWSEYGLARRAIAEFYSWSTGREATGNSGND